MEIINFFKDTSAWQRNELFFPLRRFFAPYENNPYDSRPISEIKTDFLKAIYADQNPSFEMNLIESLEEKLNLEAARFREDFGELLPKEFKVLLFPLSSNWEYVIKHLNGTWGVTFPSCIVLAAHPEGHLERLLRTLHHEANHSIRLKFIEDDHGFLDRIILEDLAEVYVDEKFPNEPSSKYAVALNDATAQAWIPQLKEFWLNDEIRFDQYKDYVYGSGQKNIPPWLGYSVGHKIVRAFRSRNQQVPWPELIQIPAAQIWNESGF
jgi:uncharacterized protein YjaZ